MIILFYSSCREDYTEHNHVSFEPLHNVDLFYNGGIEGFIVDEFENVIKFAKLEFNGETYYTDSKGTFLISNDHFHDGNNTLVVEKEGYFLEVLNVEYSPFTKAFLPIHLETKVNKFNVSVGVLEIDFFATLLIDTTQIVANSSDLFYNLAVKEEINIDQNKLFLNDSQGEYFLTPEYVLELESNNEFGPNNFEVTAILYDWFVDEQEVFLFEEVDGIIKELHSIESVGEEFEIHTNSNGKYIIGRKMRDYKLITGRVIDNQRYAVDKLSVHGLVWDNYFMHTYSDYYGNFTMIIEEDASEIELFVCNECGLFLYNGFINLEEEILIELPGSLSFNSLAVTGNSCMENPSFALQVTHELEEDWYINFNDNLFEKSFYNCIPEESMVVVYDVPNKLKSIAYPINLIDVTNLEDVEICTPVEDYLYFNINEEHFFTESPEIHNVLFDEVEAKRIQVFNKRTHSNYHFGIDLVIDAINEKVLHFRYVSSNDKGEIDIDIECTNCVNDLSIINGKLRLTISIDENLVGESIILETDIEI